MEGVKVDDEEDDDEDEEDEMPKSLAEQQRKEYSKNIKRSNLSPLN
jgi:hypothetical protein